MLLASLLLKLGGYGFLRFSLTLLEEGSRYFSTLVTVLSLLGVIYGSLSTIRQIDIKRVIAYSSVAHINLVILGLFSGNQQGVEGAIYLIIGHGVVSTALFFCIGVLYHRYHSRLIRYYGGLVVTIPLFASYFFVFTLANIGFPGTSNFLGEFLVFLGVFTKNSTILIFATAGIVLSAVYSVWLYNRICFGTVKIMYIKRFTELN
jgi:NADH-quinone oxidoreductase subunit M